MYYFYIVQSIGGRVGFGITKDYEERNKQYCSHSGDIVTFPLVFGGRKNHAINLENSIKREMMDECWAVEGWRTEWLNSDMTLEQFIRIIEEKISERHYVLEIVEEDFSISA